jgi:hypothetical protein
MHKCSACEEVKEMSVNFNARSTTLWRRHRQTDYEAVYVGGDAGEEEVEVMEQDERTAESS